MIELLIKLWEALFGKKHVPVPVDKTEFTEEERMNHWIWRHADPEVRQ